MNENLTGFEKETGLLIWWVEKLISKIGAYVLEDDDLDIDPNAQAFIDIDVTNVIQQIAKVREAATAQRVGKS